MDDKKINSEKLKKLGEKLFDEVLKILDKHREAIRKEVKATPEDMEKGMLNPLIRFGVQKEAGFGVLLWKSLGTGKRLENLICEDSLMVIKLLGRILRAVILTHLSQAPDRIQAAKEITNAMDMMEVEIKTGTDKEPSKC